MTTDKQTKGKNNNDHKNKDVKATERKVEETKKKLEQTNDERKQLKKNVQAAKEVFKKSDNDAAKLKLKLQKEEEIGLLKADKKDYPRDNSGKRISDKKVGDFVRPIAGKGTGKKINDINRIVEKHGGKHQDWSKDSTNVGKLSKKSERSSEMHSYQNSKIGKTVEIKSKEKTPSEISKSIKENKADMNIKKERRSESKRLKGR
ncbi:MAG: hypothetical protein EOP56_02615 [Sphingobacteriales bacterium]|nr:MAG: hypothetical protein EOP56_02615 [Sphingobacteriales bacterium]